MANNEFGDFQTPNQLATACVNLMDIPSDAIAFEPTCGRGSFLKAISLASPESERFGLEINHEYVAEAQQYGIVTEGDFFEFDFSKLNFSDKKPLYIIGNPPWVTSADLKKMNSGNIPDKKNFKNAKGFDALLGSSNFDVCEYIILKLLGTYANRWFKLGMLCKTQVARNIIEFAAKNNLTIPSSAIYRINAMQWFNAAVDACWFTLTNDPNGQPSYTTEVHESTEEDSKVTNRFGILKNRLISNIDDYLRYSTGDDESPYEWRSGIKHDASKIFELKSVDGKAVSSFGDVFDPDGQYILPLLKSTDVFRGKPSTRYVIVPQHTFGGSDKPLKNENPELWEYLDRHADIIDNRKSSIYRGKARFTVFGHGDYTYAPYKLATSGLHKDLEFRIVKPINGTPVVLDDTCYFIPFYNPTEVCLVKALLDSPSCSGLIRSLVFWDSKRPISKKLLSRINMFKVPNDPDEVLSVAENNAAQLDLDFDIDFARSLLTNGTTQSTLFD